MRMSPYQENPTVSSSFVLHSNFCKLQPFIQARFIHTIKSGLKQKMATPSVPDYRRLVDIHDRQFQKAALDHRIYFVPVDEVCRYRLWSPKLVPKLNLFTAVWFDDSRV
jgi:hypothetical protein